VYVFYTLRRNLAVAAISHHSTLSPPLVFLLDVDFIPSPGLSDWVEQHLDENETTSPGLLSRCMGGEVFVVPAFERQVAEQHHESEKVTLETVCGGIQDGSVTPFHVSHFPAGHNPTDYERWVLHESYRK